MRRREFIGLLGGAAAWPLAARGQQPANRLYRVGLLFSSTPLADMAGAEPNISLARAFVHGLRALGYVEGQNLLLERRSAEGKFDRLAEIAAELVRLKSDVIVTGGGNLVAQEVQRVTKAVPVVMANSDDPVGAGLVASLARPGGNITGFTGNTGPEFETKRLEILKEAVPHAIRVAFLGTKDDWQGRTGQRIQGAAPTLGMKLVHAEHTGDNYANAFARMAGDRSDALFVARHPANYVNTRIIVEFAVEHQMPGMYPYQESVAAGGLISYGVNLAELYRRAAGFVDKILRGTKPAELPIEQPTKFELTVNLRTAKALGLTIPPTLLARADEVIE